MWGVKMNEIYQIRFEKNRLMDRDGLEIEEVGENSYRIALKNGSYKIRVYDGDLSDRGDVNVYPVLNGIRQSPIWAGDCVIRSMEYETEVVDKWLELSFVGKYVCIQEVDIAPVFSKSADGLDVHLESEGEKCEVVFSYQKEEGYGLRVRRWEAGAGREPKIFEFWEDTCRDNEIEWCKTYRYEIRKIDRLGFESTTGREIKLEIKDESRPIGEVDLLSVETEDAYRTRIRWEGAYAFAYEIYRKTTLCSFKRIALTTECEYVDEEMYTDRSYIYGVRALSYGGASEIQEMASQKKMPQRKRQMEYLNRGAVAIRTDKGMYLAFRLFADEYETTEFEIDKNGTFLTRLTKADATNYLDEGGQPEDVYEIYKIEQGRRIAGEKAKNLMHNYLDVPVRKPEPRKTPDGNTYEYTLGDASVADLDGDGEYEIVVKWDCNPKDNSHPGYSGIVFLDAYKMDGTLLWRIDMGVNIRCGAHYTQFMVYDFDGDGCAEMILKTADGTVDGCGRVIGDAEADYRNREGFILDGKEYLSLVDGRTGAILDTVLYDPPRGRVSDWGDSWGNRVDRFLACVAYLDGMHPSAVMCRGYYDHGRPTHLAAYDVRGKKLVKRWKFVADATQNIEYTNQGFHNLSVADVDGDGCDEIVYGACVIDHDGTGLYSTGLGHGDAMHLGKFTADSVGYDYFGIHEDADCPWGIEAHDAGTGRVTFGLFTGKDTARGLTAKIDPRYDGNQMWAYFGEGLYNYKDGKKISEHYPANINFAIWWDGDLLRELLDHDWFGYETCVGIPKIYKWNWETEETYIIFSTDGVLSNNGTKGNPCIQASLFGDWREEVVFRSKDSTFLRIYTTTEPTPHRIYTLMHDPVYRMGIAWQNTAYNQPPHTGFYIGPDMKELPVPVNTYPRWEEGRKA